MKLCSAIFLFSLGAACAPKRGGPVVDSIIALGWVECIVDDLSSGHHKYTHPHQSLPRFGADAEVIDTNAIKLTLARSVSEKGNAATSSKSEHTSAEWMLKYELRRSEPVPPGDVILYYSLVSTTALSLNVEPSRGAKARGFARTHSPPVASGPHEIGFARSALNQTAMPKTIKTFMRIPSVAWEDYGADSRMFVNIWVHPIDVVVATVSDGSSTGTTVAKGIGMTKLYPSHFTTEIPSRIITGTVNTAAEMMFVDLFSTSGTLLASYGAPVDSSGSYELHIDESPGSYVAFFQAPGSLRRRVSITYDPAKGLSRVNVSLRFGDLDGDNYVSQTEVDFVARNVGQSARWNYGDGYDIRLADFDGDGTISAADASAAAANLGASGD